MDNRKKAFSLLVVVLFMAYPPSGALTDTFTVTTTADTGAGSFRQALLDVNNHTGADSILFNIPLSDENYTDTLGVWTIRPASALPEITHDSTHIDATSQSEFIGSDTNPHGPEIELDGSLAGTVNGLDMMSGYNLVRGFIVNRFEKFGIRLAYQQACYNRIGGNYIGTDATGTKNLGNHLTGIMIYSGAKHNTIGGTDESMRNIVSGNGWAGIEIQGTGADSNIVCGNFIGTDASGNMAMGNKWYGIYLWSGARYNQIGLAVEKGGNIISGNGRNGIYNGPPGTNHNLFYNNDVGLNKDATRAIPNQWSGFSVSGDSLHIGGPGIYEGNVVSGNDENGILLSTGTGSTIAGNVIGTDKNGITALPNQQHGILIIEGANDNTIGPDNRIYFNNINGIHVKESGTIGNTITRNAISDNEGAGISTVDGGNTELSPPVVLSSADGAVMGSAPPNSVVEIFSDPGNEGAIFEGETVTTADGSFTWSGSPTGPFITATATDANGNTSAFSPGLDTAVRASAKSAPAEFYLEQNYPNPFNPITAITYQIAEPTRVVLTLYDITGKHLTTLVNEDVNPGHYRVLWNGNDHFGKPVASGFIFYRLEAGDFVNIKKMIKLK
jgi:hypothetical protein